MIKLQLEMNLLHPVKLFILIICAVFLISKCSSFQVNKQMDTFLRFTLEQINVRGHLKEHVINEKKLFTSRQVYSLATNLLHRIDDECTQQLSVDEKLPIEFYEVSK